MLNQIIRSAKREISILFLLALRVKRFLVRKWTLEINRRGLILNPKASRITTLIRRLVWRYLGALFENSDEISANSYGGEALHFISYAQNHPSSILVDVGAADGRTLSNTARAKFLFGNPQILVESYSVAFAQLALNSYSNSEDVLVRIKVTPNNIVSLSRALHLDEKAFAISIDIDSYDFFVVEQLLTATKPEMLCVEWNPIFPADVFFAVTEEFQGWEGNWFFGASAAAWCELFAKYDYSVIDVCGMSLIAIPNSQTELSLDAHQILNRYLTNPDFAATPTSKALIEGDISKVEETIEEIIGMYSGFYVYRKSYF